MEVISYLKIIGRYWWVILLTTLVATGVATAITSTRSKSYTVHARVVAQPSSVLSDTRTLVDMSGQVGTRTVMGTLAQVFTSADVRNNALRIVGHTNYKVPVADLRAAYERMCAHAAAGELTADYERVPLDDAPAAWERQRSGPGTKLVVFP